MIGWYLKVTDPVLARVWKVSTEKSTHDFLNWEAEKEAWVHEFHEKVCVSSLLVFEPNHDKIVQVWDAQGFDAIIGPGLASPALIHE